MVLEKLWRTYVELFDRALKDLNDSLKRQESHIGKVEVELERVRKEVAEMRVKHPAHLERLKNSLERKFAQRHQEQHDRVKLCEAETQTAVLLLAERKREIKTVFPHFYRYEGELDGHTSKTRVYDWVSALALDVERLCKGFKGRDQIRAAIAPLLADPGDIAGLRRQWQENANLIAELQKDPH